MVREAQRVKIFVVEQKTGVALPLYRERIRVQINTANLCRADLLSSPDPASVATDRVTVDRVSAKISKGNLGERIEIEMSELRERMHHLDHLYADLLKLTHHFDRLLLSLR